MKKINLFLLFLAFGCTTIQKAPAQKGPEGKKYNVLFIAVDDLKPYINSFGYKAVSTPNLDKLAKSSTIFNQNYCQQAVCAPTRASLLTGLRPDKTEIWDLKTMIRDKNPNVVTLPQYFKENGYVTSAMGKIFDPRSVDKHHDEVSWSEPYKKNFRLAEGYEDIVIGSFHSPELKEKFKEMQAQRAKKKGGDKNEDFDNPKITRDDIKVTTEGIDVPDDAYFDGAMAKFAQHKIRKSKDLNEPFFMAVGFKKPHLPFVAPKKYWDLYNRDEIELAAWQKPAIDGPAISYHNSGEMRSYADIAAIVESEGLEKNSALSLPEDKQRELIHGYYACISYIDAQIGEILKTLKSQGLEDNTIIVLWGDHGWHFGDHNLWAKHSNFEQATKSPLLIKVPGMTSGSEYMHPTEFVDIFPTLCDITGLEKPAYLDGESLLPALKNNEVVVKDFAISQFPRGGKNKQYMGYSIRSGNYRYTEWVGPNYTTEKPFDESLIFTNELYELNADPDETVNIAAKKEVKNDLKMLSDKLHAYYQQQYETRNQRN